jgi:hypothetical protein
MHRLSLLWEGEGCMRLFGRKRMRPPFYRGALGCRMKFIQVLQLANVLCCRALGTLNDIEADTVAFGQ